MRGKYIIFRRDDLVYPVIFPNHFVNHNEIYDKKYGFPISAGFFYIISADEIYVSGKSISLDLVSRKEDAEILLQFFKS
jgi:hypothetical protein